MLLFRSRIKYVACTSRCSGALESSCFCIVIIVLASLLPNFGVDVYQDQALEGSLLPAKGKGKAKQKAIGKASSKSRPVADAPSGQGDDEEDVLQDYELSDDSEMED